MGGANLQPSILHRGGWVSANLQLAGLTTPPSKLRFATSPCTGEAWVSANLQPAILHRGGFGVQLVFEILRSAQNDRKALLV